MDSAGDAVVELGIQLGQGVASVDRGLGYVSDGGSLNNIPAELYKLYVVLYL